MLSVRQTDFEELINNEKKYFNDRHNETSSTTIDEKINSIIQKLDNLSTLGKINFESYLVFCNTLKDIRYNELYDLVTSYSDLVEINQSSIEKYKRDYLPSDISMTISNFDINYVNDKIAIKGGKDRLDDLLTNSSVANLLENVMSSFVVPFLLQRDRDNFNEALKATTASLVKYVASTNTPIGIVILVNEIQELTDISLKFEIADDYMKFLEEYSKILGLANDLLERIADLFSQSYDMSTIREAININIDNLESRKQLLKNCFSARDFIAAAQEEQKRRKFLEQINVKKTNTEDIETIKKDRTKQTILADESNDLPPFSGSGAMLGNESF